MAPEPPVEPPGPEDLAAGGAPAKRGRPKKGGNTAQLEHVLRLYFVERLSMRKVADVLGVSHMSVYRILSDPNLEILM